MDEGVVPPETIMDLLKEEKAQLEKQLETETDDSEIQEIENRIEEIKLVKLFVPRIMEHRLW